jgi:uncharacterized protein YjbI with pentapeptide repeats
VRTIILGLCCLFNFSGVVCAEIRNWQTGEVIPGTENITPQRGVFLSNWNTSSKNLRYADLANKDMPDAGGYWSWFDYAHFTNSNLTNFFAPDSSFIGADFTDAEIRGADFSLNSGILGTGINSEQLYSTKSYKNQDLTGIDFGYHDLTNWNLANQNLTDVHFDGANLTGTDFSNSIINGARFENYSDGLSAAQLYSTKSYKDKDLSKIHFLRNDLTGWNFSGQNLTSAYFINGATITGADFTDADISRTHFFGTEGGLSSVQLYSTKNYKNKDLSGIEIGFNNLTGWNFANQNLTNANLKYSNFTNTVFTDAEIRGANFNISYDGHGTGITSNQLYSTKSYKDKDISGISLGYHNLISWYLLQIILLFY